MGRSPLFDDTAGAKDKTLKLYDGNLYDLLDDTGMDAVMADITNWSGRHLP